MKKIMTVKKLLIAMVFSVAVLGGYQTYEQVSMTSVEAFLLENVEALTRPEYDNFGSFVMYHDYKNKWFGLSVGCKKKTDHLCKVQKTDMLNVTFTN